VGDRSERRDAGRLIGQPCFPRMSRGIPVGSDPCAAIAPLLWRDPMKCWRDRMSEPTR
jgi:hypothetical protein